MKTGIIGEVTDTRTDYEKLRRQLREEAVLGADETGWRLAGDKAWLWVFQNKGITYYTIANNRSSRVVEGVLGKRYTGTLVTDFFSAYEKIKACRKQKCSSHLRRDLEYGKEVEVGQDDFCRKIDELIRQAIGLYQQQDELKVGAYKKQVRALEKQLDEQLEKAPQTPGG